MRRHNLHFLTTDSFPQPIGHLADHYDIFGLYLHLSRSTQLSHASSVGRPHLLRSMTLVSMGIKKDPDEVIKVEEVPTILEGLKSLVTSSCEFSYLIFILAVYQRLYD